MTMELYKKIYDISLGTDEVTGLEKKKNVYNVIILGKERSIVVEYEIVLVTPNGYLAKTLFLGRHSTGDSEPNFPYTTYEASAVGQGIKYILSQTINTYPNE